MAVTMRSTQFWDVNTCSMVEAYRRLGRTSCLYIMDRKAGRASKQRLAWFILPSRRWGSILLRNVGKHLPHYVASRLRREKFSSYTIHRRNISSKKLQTLMRGLQKLYIMYQFIL
jgi:hypothetical protein